MSIRPENVEIVRPCPVRLDPSRVRNGARSWYCGHCEKSVHVLSNMTEREARSFLGERVGQDLCVTYAVGRDGTVRFKPEDPPAPELVPVSALRRRSAPRVAAGLGLALAACTPHAHPDVGSNVEVVAGAVDPTYRTIPDATPHLQDDDVLVDGEIEPEPIPVPGGIRVEPLPPEDMVDEPCEPKADPPLTRRGRIRSPPGVGG